MRKAKQCHAVPTGVWRRAWCRDARRRDAATRARTDSSNSTLCSGGATLSRERGTWGVVVDVALFSLFFASSLIYSTGVAAFEGLLF